VIIFRGRHERKVLRFFDAPALFDLAAAAWTVATSLHDSGARLTAVHKTTNWARFVFEDERGEGVALVFEQRVI